VTLQDVKSGKTLWSGLAKTDGPRVKGRLLDGLRGAYDQADKIRYKRLAIAAQESLSDRREWFPAQR